MFERPDDQCGSAQEPARRSATEMSGRAARLAHVRGVSVEAMTECAEALERIAAS